MDDDFVDTLEQAILGLGKHGDELGQDVAPLARELLLVIIDRAAAISWAADVDDEAQGEGA